MTKLYIEDFATAEIETIATAFGRQMQFDITQQLIGYDLDGLVATDTSITEWIVARGEPTRDGDLYVFDNRRDVPRPGKQGRTMMVGDVVYVLVTSSGTVAEVLSMVNHPNRSKSAAPKFQAPSWEAKFQGRTLGYFATAEEAEACVDAARAEADANRDAE